MGSFHPFAKQKIFEPATCEALGVAFNTAWHRLLVSDSALASSCYANATREALALHIIDLAQRGERDVNRLCDDAVAFVLNAPLPEEADAEEPEEALALEPEAQSVLSSRIRRTTYWVGDKPVSLVYIPALADQHPETINDKRPPPMID